VPYVLPGRADGRAGLKSSVRAQLAATPQCTLDSGLLPCGALAGSTQVLPMSQRWDCLLLRIAINNLGGQLVGNDHVQHACSPDQMLQPASYTAALHSLNTDRTAALHSLNTDRDVVTSSWKERAITHTMQLSA
jgi:hypothetical protein